MAGFRLLLATLSTLLRISPVTSLSSNHAVAVNANKPIERVAIIGSGIAGLSLAHALSNSPSLSDGFQGNMEVSLYDSRKALDYTLGAGMQMNGGISVLGKINPDVQKAVRDTGISVSKIIARNKSWFGDSTDSMWNIDVPQTILDAGGEAEEALVGEDGNILWSSITRGSLQETLFDTLPESVSSSAAFGKVLTGMKAHSDGGAICEFSDGSSEGPFDLVVGCDGIKSAVKEYVDTGKISEDPNTRENCGIYSGIRIRYAIQDGDPLDDSGRQTDFQQVFGDGAYAFCGAFGNGKDRPKAKGVFLVYLDEEYNGPFKRDKSKMASAVRENADWSQDVRNPTIDARQEMFDRLEHFKMPLENIGPVVENADRFFELGVYFHNPISFSGWSKEIPASKNTFAVLCGDSAHAMPPFLGQGGNQAVQDAYCLAKSIYDYNSEVEGRRPRNDDEDETPKQLKTFLKEYERVRWLPTTSITVKAGILGYLETGGRDGFYSRFRDAFFKFLFILGIPTKILVGSATPRV